MVSLVVGISFLSERAVVSDIELDKYKVYYIREMDLKRKFYFVYHKKRQLSPLNETFKSFVLEYIKTFDTSIWNTFPKPSLKCSIEW